MTQSNHGDAQLAGQRVEIGGRRLDLAVSVQLRKLDAVADRMAAQLVGLVGLGSRTKRQRRAGNGNAERRPPVDPERAGKILMQVLGLAEALPFRPRAEMQFPPLAARLAAAEGAA